MVDVHRVDVGKNLKGNHGCNITCFRIQNYKQFGIKPFDTNHILYINKYNLNYNFIKQKNKF